MHDHSRLSRRAAAALPFAALVLPVAAALPAVTAAPDPVLGQIELHRALRRAVNETSCHDDDPVYVKACRDEEAAIQALADIVPITLAGAAAQLVYMAEIEEPFADELSPLVRCVLTVAKALARGLPA